MQGLLGSARACPLQVDALCSSGTCRRPQFAYSCLAACSLDCPTPAHHAQPSAQALGWAAQQSCLSADPSLDGRCTQAWSAGPLPLHLASVPQRPSCASRGSSALWAAQGAQGEARRSMHRGSSERGGCPRAGPQPCVAGLPGWAPWLGPSLARLPGQLSVLEVKLVQVLAAILCLHLAHCQERLHLQGPGGGGEVQGRAQGGC
jgi:hypothetical protein